MVTFANAIISHVNDTRENCAVEMENATVVNANANLDGLETIVLVKIPQILAMHQMEMERFVPVMGSVFAVNVSASQ